jgi:hypothetical protein
VGVFYWRAVSTFLFGAAAILWRALRDSVGTVQRSYLADAAATLGVLAIVGLRHDRAFHASFEAAKTWFVAIVLIAIALFGVNLILAPVRITRERQWPTRGNFSGRPKVQPLISLIEKSGEMESLMRGRPGGYATNQKSETEAGFLIQRMRAQLEGLGVTPLRLAEFNAATTPQTPTAAPDVGRKSNFAAANTLQAKREVATKIVRELE